MKKIFGLVLALFVMGSVSAFADKGFSKNLFTAEATVGIPGIGVNEVAIYNRMITDKFGIGGGIEVSEGIIGNVNAFVDFTFDGWHFGVGTGFDWDWLNADILVRAVWHSDWWQWGPGKAGMVFGADWHLPFMRETSLSPGQGVLYIMHVIPRFIIGINWKIGF